MKKNLTLFMITFWATFYVGNAFAQEDAVYEDYTIRKKTYHIAVSGAADLGLSVRWAAFNVGAEKPEEDGEYFAWGETRDKSEWGYYDWLSYFDLQNENRYFQKYSMESKKEQLEDEDDVAHVRMGGSWRMPTKEEKDELTKKCKIKWITYKGKKGCLWIGKTGNAIFFPCAGIFTGSYLNYYSNDGGIWTKSRYNYPVSKAYILRFEYYGNQRMSELRSYGLNVRGVTK